MIIKWAGSKKWLFRKHPHLFTSKYNTYFEPFLGGAAVFFDLRPGKSYLSDINGKLINFYKELKKNPEELFNNVKTLIDSHSDEQYYKKRDEFNNTGSPELFLYLNRTCYNGIYRENQSGEFNVPVGRRTSSHLPFTKEDFTYFSEILDLASLRQQGFMETLSHVKENDFIYVDPPYIKFEDNYDSFRQYGKDVFSPDDLKELAERLNDLSKNNKILFSNFDLPNVKELFDGPQWKFQSIEQTSNISGKSTGRKKMKEILIYNY